MTRVPLLAALGAIAISGCAAATTTPTVSRRPNHRHAARRHGPRHRPRQRGLRPHKRVRTVRRRSHAAARGLALSHASGSVVQPQPAPGSCHARGHGRFSLPDPRCTPGAISPAVTQADLSSTICRSGYTETVRPSESITEREKEASVGAYGDPGSLGDYEYDHLVPLELGGAPNDPRNLWPEPGSIPNPKDELESRLREMVCAGQIRLGVAQREIAQNWVAAYRRVYGHR